MLPALAGAATTLRGARGVVVALALAALALAAPIAVLVVAPLLLGLPHVAASARIVLGDRGLVRHARTVLVALGPLALIAVGRAHATWSGGAAPWLELGLAGLALLATALVAAGGWARRLGVAGVVVAVTALALRWPGPAMLGLLHGHNLVALGLLVACARDRRGAGLIVVVVGLVLAAIGLGLLDHALGDGRLAGLSLEGAAAVLAPGAGAAWGPRIVVGYALLQLVHYAARLGWLAPPPAPGLGLRWRWQLVLAAPLPLLVLGGVAPTLVTRDAYLALAFVHVWWELVAVVDRLAGARRSHVTIRP